jgi:hypothetical protein
VFGLKSKCTQFNKKHLDVIGKTTCAFYYSTLSKSSFYKMKNLFSKSFLLCLMAFLVQNFAVAQNSILDGTVSPAVATRALSTGEAKSLGTHFASTGYAALPINPEETYTATGRDAEGSYTIQVVNQGYRGRAGYVDVTSVTLTRNGRAEVVSFAQSATATYAVVSGSVQALSSAARVSILDCIQQYFTSTIGDCTNCFNCVKGCVQSNSKWWAKIICGIKCVKPCFGCVKNIVGFVKCMITAIRG